MLIESHDPVANALGEAAAPARVVLGMLPVRKADDPVLNEPEGAEEADETGGADTAGWGG